MVDKTVLIDTSILIELFRKTDKDKSVLIGLVRQGYDYCISAITEYEIYAGAVLGQLEFWDMFLARTAVLPFGSGRCQGSCGYKQGVEKKKKANSNS